MNDAALADLLDARALEQMLVWYFDRVDAGDAVGASQYVSPDVEFEIMIGKRKQGRERFARSLGRVLARYAATSHHLTNVSARIDGDEADLTAYVYAFHRMRDSGEPWHLWVRLRDRAARCDGGWLITEHVLLGVDSVPDRPDIPRAWYTGHPGRLTP